jgi:transcriptional regulator with XRE-family HTH domain
LVARPIPLNGAEVRFLRTEMELTQRDLAGIIGATEQTLRLWEKNRGKFIPGTADRLLRALYSEFIGGDVHIRKMLERLADLDRLENGPTCFKKNNSSWKPLHAPQLEQMQA